MTVTKKKRPSGNDWRKKNKMKAVLVPLTEEQHGRLVLAAHAEKRSMTAFILYHTLKSIKDAEKKELGY